MGVIGWVRSLQRQSIGIKFSGAGVHIDDSTKYRALSKQSLLFERTGRAIVWPVRAWGVVSMYNGSEDPVFISARKRIALSAIFGPAALAGATIFCAADTNPWIRCLSLAVAISVWYLAYCWGVAAIGGVTKSNLNKMRRRSPI